MSYTWRTSGSVVLRGRSQKERLELGGKAAGENRHVFGAASWVLKML